MQSIHPKLFKVLAHVGGCCAILLAVAIYYGLVSRPLLMQQEATLATNARLERGLTGSLDVRRDHLRMRRRLDDLNNLVQQSRQRAPERSPESTFLREVTQIARAEGLEIVDFRRSGLRQSAAHSEVTMTLNGSGSYAAVCRLVDQINSFSYAAVVKRMDFSSSHDSGRHPFEIAYTLYHNLPTAKLVAQSEATR